MFTKERFVEIAKTLEVYEGKHGPDSIPAIDTLRELLSGVSENGTPKPGSLISAEQLSNLTCLLSETKVPLHELRLWACLVADHRMDQLREARRLRLASFKRDNT